MSRFTKVMIIMLLVVFGGALGLWWASFPILSMVWLCLLSLSMPSMLWNMSAPGGLWVLSRILPRTQLVRTMDLDGEIRYVLAYGEPGQVLHAHIYWLSQIASLQLHPNGYVTGTSYVYFWEPMCPDDLTSMHLTYDCADWHKLANMDMGERHDYRQRLADQTKLTHESHI